MILSAKKAVLRPDICGDDFGRWQYGTERIATSGRLRLPLYLAFLAAALNQSNIVLGVNLSLADVTALVALVVAAIDGRLWIPEKALGFLLAVAATSAAAVLFFDPQWLSTPVPLSEVAAGQIKLSVAFAYFVLGVNFTRSSRALPILRIFAYAGAGVSILVFFPSLSELLGLYMGGFRFKGFMNDPNYFAVLSIAALAVVWRDTSRRRVLRIASSTVLISAVLLSGSKTGLIVLAALATWRLLDHAGRERRSGIWSTWQPVFLLLAVAMVAVVLSSAWQGAATRLTLSTQSNPAIQRVMPLLTDFGSAIRQDGSGRDDTWTNALTVIQMSPIVGVGAGAYEDIDSAVNGSVLVAHNTYLQIAAEWGLPLAALFLLWVLITLLRKPVDDRQLQTWRTARDVCVVLLVGSFSVSLNNARVLWMVLGILAAVLDPSWHVGGGHRRQLHADSAETAVRPG